MTRIQKPKRTPSKPKQMRLTNRVPLRSLSTNIPRRIVARSSRTVTTAVQHPSQDVHIIQEHRILTNVSNTESFNFTYQQEVQQRRSDQENFERQLTAAHQVGVW